MDETQYYNLIVRNLSGEATDSERKLLEAWRRASEENEQIFGDIEKVWHKSPQKLAEKVPNIDQEWRQIANQLDFAESKASARILPIKKKRELSGWLYGTRRALALAAALAVILIGSLVLRTVLNRQETILTRNAEQREVHLPDGSLVRMNSGSEVAFPNKFSDSERMVSLKGEAFFEVSQDGRAFLVRTENADVQVLGTAFNVWAREHQTKVTVKEGRVSLKASSLAGSQVILTANQASVVLRDQPPAAPASVDAEQRIGWLNDMLVFDKMPLPQIVAELQRIYDVQITIADPDLADTTLTGTFRKKPVTSILASICLALELNYWREGETFVISPK